MAEVTGMRNNALPYPCYGMAWAVVFPMLDADGDLVTGATTPDAEVSLNGGTFADCTNESTEIATNSGVYYLLLTAAEMTADIVTVIAKSATAGMKTTVLTFYPRKLVVLSTGTCQGANDTGDIQLASGEPAIDDLYNGCLCVAVIDAVTEARLINDYVGSTKVAEINPAWNTAAPDNNDTYTIYLPEGRQFANSNLSAILGTVVSTPATAGILDVNVKNIDNDAASASGTVTFPNATLASTTNITAGTITTATNVTTVNGLAANVITAAATAADFGTEIATAIWTDTTAGDFTTALSVGKSIMNGVSLGTGLTVARVTLADTLTTYTGNTVQTGDSFGRIGVAGAGLTNIDLPNQTMDIVGNITGNLSGSVGSVTGLTPATVHSDLDDIQSRIPAALSNGFIKASLYEAVVGGVQDFFTVDSGETYNSAVAGSVVAECGIKGDEAKADTSLLVDVLLVAYGEPAQQAPPVSAALVDKIAWLYKAWRNKKDNDGTTTHLYADDGTTVDQKQATSSSGGTVTKGEWATGP